MVGDRAAGRVSQRRKTALLHGVLRQRHSSLPADLATRQRLPTVDACLLHEGLPADTERGSDGEHRQTLVIVTVGRYAET